MTAIDFPRPASTLARSEDTTLFVALELSRKSWLVATSAPGEAKISKRTVAASDGPGLLALLAELRDRTEKRIGRQVCVVSLYGLPRPRCLRLDGSVPTGPHSTSRNQAG